MYNTSCLITMARLGIIWIIHGLLMQNVASSSPIRNSEDNWVTFKPLLRDPAYRLPTTTKPEHYDLSLTPYFEDDVRPFTFDGTVNIHINALEDGVKQIVMHCKDIKIISILLFELVNDVEELVDLLVTDDVAQCDYAYSFLRINTVNPLQLGKKYIVRIEFSGNLQNDMTGFYRSWYYDSSGRKRWMGTTQFQPGHARRAFPCYDEPSFKATFVVTINREADFSDTISNMLRDRRVELDNGRIAETFHKTPVMSTYLLAFVVSHYDKIATDESDPERPFEIYARDNVNKTGDWSLEVGVKLLAAMEKYTGIPYYTMQDHLNMKQAAIPDFSDGAMENWGLLTYKESLILYDPYNSNHFYKQRVANIVAHEITHMWFGNLVTCAWWDNLWLNEGFARFYTYFLAASVFPDLGYEIRFVVEQVQVALFADSIDSVNALTNPSVFNPASVRNQFSAITYAKGASVLRMTQHLLGKSTFEKGLRTYLQDRKYDVSEPEDLFSALDQAASEDEALSRYRRVTISRYFKTWSEQAGHPLLTVSINHRTGQMNVVQERWQRFTGSSTISTLYHVPVTWTRGGQPNFEDLKPSAVLTRYNSIIQRKTRGLEWVIFNKQQTGFYRVNYDEDSWGLITLALRGEDRTLIHESNRAQIVDDSFALARAGVNDYIDTLNVLSFLQFEDAYAPWFAAISGFNFVRRRLVHDADHLQKFEEMIIELSTAVTTRLGYQEIPDEPFMDGLLRMYVMVFLCSIGHEQCISAAMTSFRAFRDQGTLIPANMRPWVYCTGLRNGNAEDFNSLWSKYIEDDLASEKIVLLETLGCTQDADSITKYLNNIISNNYEVRSQDYNTALYSAISGNEENTQIVFDWLKLNKDKAKETLGDLSTIISYIANHLLTEEEITEFEQWIKSNFEELENAYNTGIRGAAGARSKLKWYEERLPELAIYLENGYQDVEIILEPETTEPTTTPNSADINRITCLTLLVILVVPVAC